MARNPTTFAVDTRPTKNIVVDGLTRDASVEACIFDLIDNAVDAARETVGDQTGQPEDDNKSGSLDDFWVDLSTSGSGLVIEDNCGGISVDSLKSEVLRFGQPSEKHGSIGAFGVGLNRALFRLGSNSEIETDDGSKRSALTLNVEKYMDDSEDWEIPARSGKSTGAPGTKITISGLTTSISRDFGDKAWVDRLRAEIGLRYTKFIERGLAIHVNEKLARKSSIATRDEGPFETQHKFYKTGDGVSIKVEVGQHKEHRFSKEKGHSPDGNAKLTAQFGWTVFCNDRAILVADQTSKTGWDGKFHSEFYGFVGIVEFFCGDPSKLPWSTTKTDIDLNNPAYQAALRDMRHYVEKWKQFSDRRKKAKDLPTPPPRKVKPTASKPGPVPPSALKAPPPSSRAKKPVTKTKPDHNKYREVLPEDLNEMLCQDKQLALIHSAKKLDMADHSYLGLALLRILFEVSAVTYAQRSGTLDDVVTHCIADREKAMGRSLTPDERKKLLPKFDELVSYLETNLSIFGAVRSSQLKHSVARLRTHQRMLNGAIHNTWQMVNFNQAMTIRDECLPVLRFLIET